MIALLYVYTMHYCLQVTFVYFLSCNLPKVIEIDWARFLYAI